MNVKNNILFLLISCVSISCWAMGPTENGKRLRNDGKPEQREEASQHKKQKISSQDELWEQSLFWAIGDIESQWFAKLLRENHFENSIIVDAQSHLQKKIGFLELMLKSALAIRSDFTATRQEYETSVDVFRVDLEKAKSMKNLIDYRLFAGDLTFPHCFFTRPDSQKPKLITILASLIKNENRKIQAACFRLTHSTIIQLLKQKKEEGVAVEIIIDKDQETSLDKLARLARAGISILTTNEQMHHKFLIFSRNLFDKPLVWHGSFNITNHANTASYEDAMADDNPERFAFFQEQYNRIKHNSYLHPQCIINKE